MHKLVDKPTEVIIEKVEEVVKEHVASKGKGLSGKEAILEVLSRAADEPKFLRSMADDPHEVLKAYYTLTAEEKAALSSGDIKKIESWVGKLDERLATWLWCRLSQEKW